MSEPTSKDLYEWAIGQLKFFVIMARSYKRLMILEQEVEENKQIADSLTQPVSELMKKVELLNSALTKEVEPDLPIEDVGNRGSWSYESSVLTHEGSYDL